MTSMPLTISQRQTRSMSHVTPPPPMYPGYGPLATIPAEGFYPRPVRLLRRRRQAHQRDAEASESEKDSIFMISSSNIDLLISGEERSGVDEDFTIVVTVEGLEIVVRLRIEDAVPNPPTRTNISTLLCQLPCSSGTPPRHVRTQHPVTPTTLLSKPKIAFRTLSTNLPIDKVRHLTVNILDPSSINITAANSSFEGLSHPSPTPSDASSQNESRLSPAPSLSQASTTSDGASVDEDRHSTDTWFLYGSRTPPEMLLRAPTTNETWTLFYKDSIEPVLTAHFDTVLESYFLTLAVITLRKDAKYLSDYDIPCIVILYNPNHDLQPIETHVIEELITSNDYRFVCIIAEGWVEYSNPSNSATSRQCYMKNPTIGVSIEGLTDGTLGMFMQREDGSIAALSCAHVLGDRGAGYTVTQPAVTDFRKSYQRLETNIERVKNILTSTKNLIARLEAEKELEALKQELAVWEKLKTDDEVKLVENLRLGETLANGQWEIVTYGERTCMADYQFFSVDEERGPSIKRDYAYPDEGTLGSVTWGFSEKTGPLESDLLVRKDGKQTGLTFGFISGVYGKWRPGNVEDKDFGKMTCSEYWVLDEKQAKDQRFARHGDSGAIVIDKDGVVRGVVFADIPIKKLRVIVDPHGRIPDIAEIAEKRDENAEISVDDITSQVFEGSSFVLLQDIEMILNFSAIGGEVMFGW